MIGEDALHASNSPAERLTNASFVDAEPLMASLRVVKEASEIDALREENESIQGLKEQYRGSVPLTWVAGVIALCLVVGFLVGLWWVDHRSRKRHGGIRIY